MNVPPVASLPPTADYTPPTALEILGCPVAPITLDQTVEETRKIIATRRPHQHCVVNAGKVVLMNRDPELRRIIRNCALINADGQSVVWASWLVGRHIPERVTGIDLMERLFVDADRRGYRLYFLGAKQEVLDEVQRRVRAQFPGAVVAGAQHGYFKPSENAEVVRRVAAAHADILFVAMGSPKKEYWLAENLAALNVPFCMGVGGSFDVFAGHTKRAPVLFQRLGLEWFYRFIQEPRRLWRRYLLDNVIFLYILLLDFLHIRFSLQRMSSRELSDKETT